MNARILATAAATLLCCGAPAIGQPARDEPQPRRVVFTDIGYGTTLDDEGLLGRGIAVSGGVGFRVTPRLTLQALIDRVAYHRDIEYLTFDGRVVFAGIEAAFQSRGRSVRPYVTIGAGMLIDDGVWVQKTLIDPRLPRAENRIPRDGSFAGMTASTGLDIPISSRISIRTGLRFYGLLDTGDDLFPHIIVQPAVGTAIRW